MLPAPSTATAVPPPPPLPPTSGSSSTNLPHSLFIGREAELEQLDEAFRAWLDAGAPSDDAQGRKVEA